jgi:hypothetical protein
MGSDDYEVVISRRKSACKCLHRRSTTSLQSLYGITSPCSILIWADVSAACSTVLA